MRRLKQAVILCSAVIAIATAPGCIPVYVPHRETVELQPPVTPLAPAEELAPAQACPISLAPVKSDSSTKLGSRLGFIFGAVAAPTGGFFVLILPQSFFVVSEDPSIWAAEAVATALENAGYAVNRIDNPEAASLPVLVTVEVQQVSLENYRFEEKKCDAEVDARIMVKSRGQLIFDKVYKGQHWHEGECGYVVALTPSLALEDLLTKATPELALVLARATVAGAETNSAQ